jgi:hypothetical protein
MPVELIKGRLATGELMSFLLHARKISGLLDQCQDQDQYQDPIHLRLAYWMLWRNHFQCKKASPSLLLD